MTRHQRNCTAGTVYTYHERQKDAAESGYGTNKARLGKDSEKDFDCCCLTLQPCNNPVITEDGYLYDKEAILEYILLKKKEIKNQMSEYEKQIKKQEKREEDGKKSQQLKRVQDFVDSESSLMSGASTSKRARTDEASTSNGTKSISNMDGGKHKVLPSFWIPEHTPNAKPTLVKKPDKTVYCPMTNKPITLKSLIPVNFTLVDENDKTPLVAKRERYKCAVTHDVLSNSTMCAVLKPSGKVVTLECIKKLIKKDMTDPFTEVKLKESDIIEFKRGGTGYASTGAKNAEKARPVMMAS
ncbi:nitric oxide synthase-interacting protein [Strongylocentrotus purpuratus]|uniref:Nitric oxide synthase-interacting protein zinc-finger domain-containing protein n=1 Tax=Strongylocentrotus purpuratus TaxID=7668 RepID=A0A7M7RCW6_STRPU|nr:nitric oxide synthase-interacting protein [Strongylocentrotus purpuratus]|eukprot:XP_790354.2 PREDICTED: nitric oxide synthase-interacting protein [Strongylocentrotus purpuratus]